jgi:hypothetical protein
VRRQHCSIGGGDYSQGCWASSCAHAALVPERMARHSVYSACSYDFDADPLVYEWSFQKWVSLTPAGRTWLYGTNEPASTTSYGCAHRLAVIVPSRLSAVAPALPIYPLTDCVPCDARA